ncbi:2Fe-2S iron-sulfur cluster-binding protein [Amycolatopsis sp. NPDC005003]
MTIVDIGIPKRLVEFTVDGSTVRVPEGSTILEACTAAGKDIPTLCYGDTLEPANACRVCMVEVEGSRTLVPSCSRKAEPGMVVHTDSERTRTSRKVVLELLASATDLSTTPGVAEWIAETGADPDRFGPDAATVAQPALVDNELYVRDYGKCILCYKCVDACGDQWQNSFAISVAGRGFDARISTEFANPLPDSACVYCGNCVEVCPTGALSFKREYDKREDGTWDESRQRRTTTVCTFCGVGCNLTLHVQDNEIVKVTSPHESSVTHGNLCIKGRFGWQHVQNR